MPKNRKVSQNFCGLTRTQRKFILNRIIQSHSVDALSFGCAMDEKHLPGRVYQWNVNLQLLRLILKREQIVGNVTLVCANGLKQWIFWSLQNEKLWQKKTKMTILEKEMQVLQGNIFEWIRDLNSWFFELFFHELARLAYFACLQFVF